jgi:hypothetical protein
MFAIGGDESEARLPPLSEERLEEVARHRGNHVEIDDAMFDRMPFDRGRIQGAEVPQVAVGDGLVILLPGL